MSNDSDFTCVVCGTACTVGLYAHSKAPSDMTCTQCKEHRMESIEHRAERMFNAYNAQGPNPWKTFDGRDVPKWNELNDQVRAKWVAAAEESMR